MDFVSAVQFLASILVIVGSGVILGLSIGKRAAGTTPQSAPNEVTAGKAALYAEIAQSLDGLSDGSLEHKRYFMQRYYQALIYATDEVVQRLNTFLDSEASGERRARARDDLLLAMRRDIQATIGLPTSLQDAAFYKIEVGREEVRPSHKTHHNGQSVKKS